MSHHPTRSTSLNLTSPSFSLVQLSLLSVVQPEIRRSKYSLILSALCLEALPFQDGLKSLARHTRPSWSAHWSSSLRSNHTVAAPSHTHPEVPPLASPSPRASRTSSSCGPPSFICLDKSCPSPQNTRPAPAGTVHRARRPRCLWCILQNPEWPHVPWAPSFTRGESALKLVPARHTSHHLQIFLCSLHRLAKTHSPLTVWPSACTKPSAWGMVSELC